jgi:hypothetical protein
MIRVTQNLVLLLFVLLAVTGCKFFEVQSEYQYAKPGYFGTAARTKATQGTHAQPAANATRLSFSDWSAPSY